MRHRCAAASALHVMGAGVDHAQVPRVLFEVESDALLRGGCGRGRLLNISGELHREISGEWDKVGFDRGRGEREGGCFGASGSERDREVSEKMERGVRARGERGGGCE